MDYFIRRLIMFAVLATLTGCNSFGGRAQATDESAQQIANRAQEISAAADTAINQQIADIEAASNASQEAEADTAK